VNITYEVRIEPEDEQVRGNAAATDDAEADKRVEDAILQELKCGNITYWCCISVIAKVELNGTPFAGQTSLGCCSYSNNEECLAAVDEYGMKELARDDLKRILKAQIERGRLASIFDTLQHVESFRTSHKSDGDLQTDILDCITDLCHLLKRDRLRLTIPQVERMASAAVRRFVEEELENE
jgi:hypothetical protein